MSRFIKIGDSLNFRHLGGYETDDGRRTRADALYRGGWFDLANDQDEALFESTGIKQIFDFRTDMERENQPLRDKIKSRADVIAFPISPGSMAIYLMGVKDMAPEEIDCKYAMIQMHSEMLDEGVPRFRGFFRRLVDNPEPFLMMCSTGKDRTGVASALLLLALGVSRDRVFEDYLVSAEVYRGYETTYARNHGLEALGMDLRLFTDMYTVHAEYLDAVLHRIDEMAGSVEQFLLETMQLTARELECLRDAFTE